MTETLSFTGSPAAAYRADMRDRRASFGTDDDAWLAAANALHFAATSSGARRKNHLMESLGFAIDLLGDEEIDAYVQREWQGIRCYVEALVALIERIQEEGAVRLAATMLDNLSVAATALSPLEQGRLLAFRARLERRLGNLDEAAERYQYIASLARNAGSAELEARAHIGLAAIAQVRGNLPELRAHSSTAAELADRHGLRALARLAYQGLTVAGGKQGQYDDALFAGWKVVQLSNGDAVAEAEALQNLGQVLLDAGHPAIARASFAAVLARHAPARLLLNALGGLALASARLANEATVEWSVREVWSALQSTAPRYEVADALLECAGALHVLGRDAESARYREAALVIATDNGFHELVFRAGDLSTLETVRGAKPSALPERAAAIAREVSEWEPDHLPAHVHFDAAPV